MKMVDFFKKHSGTLIYVLVFQIVSLLPLPYVIFASDSSSVVMKKGILQFLFDSGISGLPRAESLALSYAYRLTSGELVVYFSICVVALVLGLTVKKLVSGNEKRASVTRYVLAALIAADIVVRFIPFRFNYAFGTLYLVIGTVIRAISLALVVTDICINRKKDRN